MPNFDEGKLDIDNDGIIEQYVIGYGPTSGLFTLCIQAVVNGGIKYNNMFESDAYKEIHFEKAENGQVYLSTIDFDGNKLNFAVSIKDGNIVLTGTDGNSTYINYFGQQGVTE